MMILKLARKNKDADRRAWEALYERRIEERIRTRYSINQELAVLRQRDVKPEEFAEYNNFVERCKAEVKAEMQID